MGTDGPEGSGRIQEACWWESKRTMFLENKRMTRTSLWLLLFLVVSVLGLAQTTSPVTMEDGQAALSLPQSTSGKNRTVRLDQFFYETAQGRTMLPAQLTAKAQNLKSGAAETQAKMPD